MSFDGHLSAISFRPTNTLLLGASGTGPDERIIRLLRFAELDLREFPNSE
jgi:hypothetical protein